MQWRKVISSTMLLQPTVFALSFLLLIMNLEQVRCNEEIKFLYHGLSQKYLTMHDNGSVSTVSDSEGPRAHQCLVLKSVVPKEIGEPLKLSIYNPSTGRYLCFKKGKLFGMRKRTKNCHFIESFDETRHAEYRQNKRTRELSVAFSTEGKPQKKKKKNAQFMKMDPKYGDCADYLNETVVPLRHKHNHKHSKKHKSMV